jgi:hypothetical protein
VVAFANVAAGNVRGETILDELHANTRRKQICLLIDEFTMVSNSMRALLVRYAFTGSQCYLFGDPHGHFGAIADQHRSHLTRGMQEKPFFHDLCNGIRISLAKFRGGDARHFNFVGSIYPQRSMLQDAVQRARVEYPCKGVPEGTVLCVMHAARVVHNKSMNRRFSPRGLDAGQGTRADAAKGTSAATHAPLGRPGTDRGVPIRALTLEERAEVPSGGVGHKVHTGAS